MDQCNKHPGREAVGECLSCAAYLCDECVSQKEGDRLLCYDCAVKVTLSEFDKKEKRGQVIAAVRQEKAKKASREGMRGMTVFVIVGAIIIVLQGGVVLTDYLMRNPGETSFIWSNLIQARYERDLCAGNLHRLSLTVETYKKDHNGGLPPSLDSFVPGGDDTVLVCPATSQPYLYTFHEDSYELSCPSPREHGLVYLSDENGKMKWRNAEE
jgi:hypothetical protein